MRIISHFAVMDSPPFRASPIPGSPGSGSWRRAAFLAALVLMGISAPAQTAPTLQSVNPPDGATLVPTTAAIVFVFDQEMDTTVPLFQSIPNALAGNFEVLAPGFNQSLIATWGADKKSITLKAAIQFPYATFTWRLNPTGSIFPLKSKAGVRLATVSGTFATGVGGTVPVLGSTSPANNDIGVGLDVVISFNFDQAMRTNTAIAGNAPATPGAIAWSGAGLDATKFRYSWSANGRSLLCDYLGDLPANTDINWVVNPPGAPVKLENPAGLVVPTGTYAGTFRTGSGIPCNTPGLPAGMGNYTLYKSTGYLQASNADPVAIAASGSHNFGAIVQGGGLGPAPTAASLAWPDGTVRPLEPIPGVHLQLNQKYDTEAAMEAAVPPGNYLFRFTLGTQPEVSVPLTLPAALPPVPKVLNFDAGQAIRADAEFTLTWNAFTGAGAGDVIAITLIDDRGRVRFSAPDPCVPRELSATATSVVIPARSFVTNSLITGTLVFSRNFYYSTNAIPKMAGFGSITRSTQFSLRTLPGGGVAPTPERPKLSNPILLPNGHPRFEVKGTPGARYTIQRSSTLGEGAGWADVLAITLDAAGTGTAEDSSTARPAFYRAMAP